MSVSQWDSKGKRDYRLIRYPPALFALGLLPTLIGLRLISRDPNQAGEHCRRSHSPRCAVRNRELAVTIGILKFVRIAGGIGDVIAWLSTKLGAVYKLRSGIP